MDKCLTTVLYGLMRLLGFIPLRLMYVISDFVLYPLIYHVFRYRRRVVRENLKRCFPEESEAQRRAWERAFYHQFCDNIQESIHQASITPEELQERLRFDGYECLYDYLRQGKNVLIYYSHYANWEYQSFFNFAYPGMPMYAVYKPQKAKFLNDLLVRLRGRFGLVLLPKQRMARAVYEAKSSGQYGLFGLIADQYAAHDRNCYLMDFLGQPDTHVLNGVERLARHTASVVTYADVRRTGRGHYQTTLKVITEDPSSLPEREITARYLRLLEETIRRAPAYWLWTHRRWK